MGAGECEAALRGLLAIPLLVILGLPSASRAGPNALDAVVTKAVRRNYEALHGCYRQMLAVDRSRGGTIFMRVTVGIRDNVTRAVVERDGLKHPGTVACLRGWIKNWTIHGAIKAGLQPGSDLVIPLMFRPVPDQFIVRVEDAPTIKVGTKTAARTLLTKGSVGARRASMSVVSVAGQVHLPNKREVDQVLYVLLGAGKLTTARKTHRLRAGAAVWLPPGVGATISGSLELIQVFMPGGLEKGFAKAKAPTGEAAARVVVAQPRRRAIRLQKGKLLVRPLLRPRKTKHKRFYVGLLEIAPGAVMPAHAHLEAEQVYVLAGQGKVTAGSATRPVGPGQAVHLGPGTRHSVAITSKMKVLQIYAPAGPEQRYFKRRGKRR